MNNIDDACSCWPPIGLRRLANSFSSGDRPDRPDPADFTIADQEGTTSGRLPGTISGQQFMIRNCKDSHIYLFDHSATITIDDCEGCKFFFGPIKGSIFFRNCKDCQSVVACQQFRTRDCKKMETFLHCTSQPIIEASTGMKFGCYQYSYPELQDQFEKAGLTVFSSNWFNIHDFTPVDGENNWSLLPEGVEVESYVPKPVADDFSTMKISTDQEFSVVPVTRGSRTKNYDQSCLLLFFGNATKKCMEFMKELKNKTSFDIIQTKEIKMSTADVNRILKNEDYSSIVENGPAVGIEVNGVEIFDSCSDVRSSLNIAQSELHISNSKEAAQSEIDAFYNFVDMSMS